MGFTVRLNKAIRQIIEDAGIRNDTRLFAAGEARRLMYDYVPMDTGALADTAEVSISDEDGKARVFYPQPYAAACYYGETLKFSSEKHQQATAFWDIAMMQSHKTELASCVDGYIKQGESGEEY